MIRIEFPPEQRGRPMAQSGFLFGDVRLGDYVETVQCDMSEWDKARYERHWIETFNVMVEKKGKAIFCSSLSEESVDLWIAGFRKDRVCIVNFIANRNDVILDGLIISSAKIENLYDDVVNEDGISKWEISKNDL